MEKPFSHFVDTVKRITQDEQRDEVWRDCNHFGHVSPELIKVVIEWYDDTDTTEENNEGAENTDTVSKASVESERLVLID